MAAIGKCSRQTIIDTISGPSSLSIQQYLDARMSMPFYSLEINYYFSCTHVIHTIVHGQPLSTALTINRKYTFGTLPCDMYIGS